MAKNEYIVMTLIWWKSINDYLYPGDYLELEPKKAQVMLDAGLIQPVKFEKTTSKEVLDGADELIPPIIIDEEQ